MKIKFLSFLLSLLPIFSIAQTVFWSEDFSSGFNSPNGQWTLEGPDTLWKHSFYGTSGEWSFGTPQPQFSSVANGFALFDGDSANWPNSPSYDYYTGSLVSPSIDVSAQVSCMLSFENFARCLKNTDTVFTLEISADDGLTWMFHDLSYLMHEYDNPELYEINISNYVMGSSTVRLRFTFGWEPQSHYFWAIDDIKLFTTPVNDLSIQEVHFDSTTNALGPAIEYSIIPTCQTKSIYPYASFYNEGSSTQTNVRLAVDVEHDGAPLTSLLSGSSSLAPWLYDEHTTNIFNQSLAVGEYSFRFEIMQDEIDENPANNVDTISYELSLNEYARDREIIGGFYNTLGGNMQSIAFELGNLFEIQEATSPEEILVYSGNLTDSGVVIYGTFYSYDASNGSFTYIGQTNDYTATAQDTNTWVTLDVPSGISFNTGQVIFAGIGMYSSADFFQVGRAQSALPYTAFHRYTDSVTWQYSGSTPAIRMKLTPCDVSLEEGEFAEVKLFPNPNQGEFTISNVKAGTKVEVYNSLGAIIMSDQVRKQEATFQVPDLAKGVYYVRLHNEGASHSIKMLVD